MKGFRIVNYAETIAGQDWNFLEDQIRDLEMEWHFFQNSPANLLEKIVQKPNISRYRACLQAVLKAKKTKADLIITHLPRASYWTAVFADLLNLDIPHLAFSFNFTDLPVGKTRQLCSSTFSKIDRFVVYSSYEKSLYADYFGIEPQRIDTVLWSMDRPLYKPSQSLISGEYICAVGGEGRDYRTLAAAMKVMPEIKLAIVARWEAISGLEFPRNVEVFTDLPSEQFWNIVKFSRISVLPLRDELTNCGHISIVGSMMFGKPIVTTTSVGTADYVFHNVNALISPPQNVASLVENMRRLWEDSELVAKLGQHSQSMADSRHQLSNWAGYLKQYLYSLT